MALPINFKMPVMPPYGGKTKPLEHVSIFNNHMNLTTMTSPTHYRCFFGDIGQSHEEVVLETSYRVNPLVGTVVKGVYLAISACLYICDSVNFPR